jgi:cytochrome c-type biogenesis protein CcmH
MMLFWMITAAMILVALVMLAPALLRKRAESALDRDRQNLVIARERLNELKAERESGGLDPAQYEQARLELEQVLLDDIDEKREAPELRTSSRAGWTGMLSLLVLVPLLTIGLYYQLGHPDMASSVDPRVAAHAGGTGSGQGMPSVEEMLGSLVERLKENPQDAEGWFLLGRSLMVVKEYPKASTAFENLHGLVGDQPTVLLAWADAAAMAQGGSMSGKPAELVRQAVGLAPDDTTALWLAGMVEAQDGNYSKALVYWERLQPLLQDDPQSSQRIAAMMATAREKGGMSAASAAPVSAGAAKAVSPASVEVRVTMAPELQGKVGPEQRLFIFATALQGPKMPLAAARLQAKDLPVELTLDDSSAMTPAMKLSNFEQVKVGARISRSGNPIAGSGDLTGEVAPVKVTGAGVVEIVIDKVVP